MNSVNAMALPELSAMSDEKKGPEDPIYRPGVRADILSQYDKGHFIYPHEINLPKAFRDELQRNGKSEWRAFQEFLADAVFKGYLEEKDGGYRLTWRGRSHISNLRLQEEILAGK